jgi:hypothetical protein
MLFVKVRADRRRGRDILVYYIPEDKSVFSFSNINYFRIFHQKFKALYTLLKLLDPNLYNKG